MVEIAQAVAQWKRTAEGTDLTKHPHLFVAHYSRDQLQASTWVDQATSELVLLLGSPFATSHIEATVIVVDLTVALSVSRLAFTGKGVWEKHWIAPYSIDDYGEYTFDLAYPRDWTHPGLKQAIQAIGEHRNQGQQHPFEDSFAYSVEAARAALSLEES